MSGFISRTAPWLAIALAIAGFWLRPPPPGPEAAPRAAVGFPAPDFELKTLRGDTVRLRDLRGRAVMINFWASWCRPCRIEMPEVDRLARRLAAGADSGGGAIVLAVNWTASERGMDDVQRFVREGGFDVPVPLDLAGEVARAYQVRALPSTYFVDPRGVIAARYAGPMNAATMAAALEAAASAAAAAAQVAPGPQAAGGGVATTAPTIARLPLLPPPLPPALSIGGLTLPTSAATLLAGIVLLIWLTDRLGRSASDALTRLLAGAFVGSRLPDLIADPAAALANPLGALLSRGPRAAWGALAGAVLVGGWMATRRLRFAEARGRLSAESLDRLGAPLLAAAAVAAIGWDDPRALPAALALGLAAGAAWRWGAFASFGGLALLAAELFAPAAAAEPGLSALQWLGLALTVASAASYRRANLQRSPRTAK